jgi:protein ImuA
MGGWAGVMSETLDFGQGDPRERLVEGLRRQVGAWEVSRPEEATGFSLGTPALDRLLPGESLRYGMLTEWLSELARSRAATLSLLSAREACRASGVLVVIDRRQVFYPPAAAAWGIDLNRLVIVRPQNARDELWAAVQALRSPAVAAMWAMIDRLDSRAFRRLQLAAQSGRTLGLLLRPMCVRDEPSWADVRLAVSRPRVTGQESRVEGRGSRARKPGHPYSRFATLDFRHCVHVRVLRARGARAGGSVMLEIDDAAHMVREARGGHRHGEVSLPVVSQLVDPAAHAFPARA